MKKRKSNKIALCCGSGGHYEELSIIDRGLLPQFTNRFWVVNKSFREETRTDAKEYYVIDYGDMSVARMIAKIIILLAQNLYIFIKERPNVLISTGPLTGIGIAVLVHLTGGKVVFIECSAQVKNPSLSGKIFYRISNQFFVQWSSLLGYYPNALFKGQLLR